MARAGQRKQLISQILSIIQGEKTDIWVILTYAVGIGVCSLVVPIAVQSLISSVAFGTLLQPLVLLTLIVAGVLAFAGSMRLLQLIAAEIIQRRLVVRASLSVGQKLLSVSVREFSRHYGSEYTVRFMELFAIQKLVTLILLDGTAFLFQVVMSLILVSFYHPLFLGFTLLLFACLIILVFGFGISGIRTSALESGAKYEIMGWLQSLAKHPETFKSARGETYALSHLDELITAYLDTRALHFKVLLRHTFGAVALQASASALLLGIGGWLVIKGQLTLGQLVAAELAFGFALANLTKLGRHLEKFYDLSASISKLDSLFDLPYEPSGGNFFGTTSTPAHLSVIDVTIQSDGFPEPLLKKLCFELLPGEKAVIYGANGTGKSHLADLIFRLTQPATGRIELDSHPINLIHPRELRGEVALVRGVELFHGTIEENLLLGCRDINPIQLREALDAVGLQSAVYGLPEGLKTKIRGISSPLSTGQALRLMIARALLTKSRLLVIDGAMDSMDERAQQRIIETLKTKCHQTILILTQEAKLARSLPRAARIENGELAAFVSV